MPLAAASSTLLRALLLAVFLDMVAFAIILPGLPFFAVQLGGGGLELGILLSSYSLAKLVGATAAGRLSDWYGRRPVLLACLAGSGVSFLLTGYASSLTTLALARAVAGLFGGTVATSQAALADVTPPSDRARRMGFLGAAVGMGFVVGPAIGASLAGAGFRLVALVGAALAFANTAIAWYRLPATPRPTSASAIAPRRPGSLWHEVGQPGVRAYLVAGFFTLFAFVSMETTLALLAHDRFALQPRGFGLMLAVVGVIMVLVQGGLIGRLTTRFGERGLAMSGSLLLGAAMLGLPAAHTLPAAFGVLAVLAVGQGLLSPSLAALLSRSATGSTQGGILGLGQSLSAAGRALAPLIAGWLYDRGDAWPFVLGGVLALMGAGSVVAARRRSLR